MPSPFSTFIDELRRRRVFRVAAFYGGIAFVIVQIIDGTFEVMGIPAWVSRLMIIVIAVGFPVSMILAWVFDITPEGIVRTEGRPNGKLGTSNSALIAVAIAAIAFGVWGRWGGSETRDRGASGPLTIAVLPLENYMDDSEKVYLVRGFQEAIISELSRINAFEVISRNSSSIYTSGVLPTKSIAEELDADILIEGSMFKIGDQLRVTIQVIDGKRDKHLWAEEYERSASDLFRLYPKLAGSIAKAIHSELLPDEVARLQRAQFVEPEAYEYYFQGMTAIDSSSQKAVKFFREAISISPTFTKAHVGLARAYENLIDYSGVNSPYSDLAWRALNDAFASDSLSGDAYAFKSFLLANEYHWGLSRIAHDRALELEPGSASVLAQLTAADDFSAHYEEAIEHYQQRERLDPESARSPFFNYWYGHAAYHAYKFEYALSIFDESISRFPNYPPTYRGKAGALLALGKKEEALRSIEKTLELWGDQPNQFDLGFHAVLLAANKDTLGANQILKNLLEKSDRSPVISMALSFCYFAVGNDQEALNFLERAYDEDGGIRFFFEFMDPLRKYPRYIALLNKMGQS